MGLGWGRVLAAIALAFAALLPAASAQTGGTGKRVALLIANSTYDRAEKASAHRDIDLVGKALAANGFDVQLLRDLTDDAFRASLASFKESARGADVGLVYYVGFGFEIDGENRLLGVNQTADLLARTQPQDLIGIGDLADSVRQARQIGIVMVDGGRPRFGGGTRGFTLVRKSQAAKAAAEQNDVIIIYSSLSGQGAAFRPANAETGSPFAEAIARHLQTPGLELGLFARRVAADVQRETNKEQEPELLGNFAAREFYFREAAAASQIAGPAAPAPQGSFTRADAAVFSNQPRVALVIGNSDYNRDGDANDLDPDPAAASQFLPDLANPRNDARDIRSALEAIRFKVTYVEDATKTELENGLIAFGRAVREAGPGALVLIYFAGHGLQVEGANYLVPVGAELPSEDLAYMTPGDTELVMRRVTVPMNDLVSRLANPDDQGLNVIILDACRNNPWERKVAGANRSAARSRGLADMPIALRRTVLAFATKPGDVAADGDGRNSPFTASLKKNLVLPGLNVRDMFDLVGAEVEQNTKGRQVPFVNSPSVRGACLGACPAAAR